MLGGCFDPQQGGRTGTALPGLAAVPGSSVPGAPLAPYGPGLMTDGAAIGASPAPWIEFCRRNGPRSACGASPTRVAMTPARWAQLQDLQRRVTNGVIQRPDPIGLGDRWQLLEPGGAGDCEDIALTKRDALIDLGWPAGALRPAICYARGQPIGGGEMHLVLTVDTDTGTWVMGNLTDEIRSWRDSDCAVWVMRESGGGWRWIEGGMRVPLRASLR
jgi:predicted transglutaminase-like cysteine proteinase